MKKIYLIGDSIRFGAPGSPGYGVYVKERLKDEIEVYAPDENCRFAQHTLRFLHEWAEGMPCEEIDLVHWNNGAWDVLRLFGDEPLTDIDFYGKTLERIYKRIRFLFPKAKIIFAFTTSAKQEWEKDYFSRRNREIEMYNQKAVEVLSPLGVIFNDLYSITSGFEDAMRSDWVHFADAGCEILADAVIAKCREVLNEN